MAGCWKKFDDFPVEVPIYNHLQGISLVTTDSPVSDLLSLLVLGMEGEGLLWLSSSPDAELANVDICRSI